MLPCSVTRCWIKSSQTLFKIGPKAASEKNYVFSRVQKVDKLLGCCCERIWGQDLSKIAQYGHTALLLGSLSNSLRLILILHILCTSKSYCLWKKVIAFENIPIARTKDNPPCHDCSTCQKPDVSYSKWQFIF